MVIIDWPYLETKEYIGGLSILETANLDEALASARKGAKLESSNRGARDLLHGPSKKLSGLERRRI